MELQFKNVINSGTYDCCGLERAGRRPRRMRSAAMDLEARVLNEIVLNIFRRFFSNVWSGFL